MVWLGNKVIPRNRKWINIYDWEKRKQWKESYKMSPLSNKFVLFITGILILIFLGSILGIILFFVHRHHFPDSPSFLSFNPDPLIKNSLYKIISPHNTHSSVWSIQHYCSFLTDLLLREAIKSPNQGIKLCCSWDGLSFCQNRLHNVFQASHF